LFGFGAEFRNWAEMLVEDMLGSARQPGDVHIPGRGTFDLSQPREVDADVFEALEKLR
jgi:hypothetical protein